MPTLALAVALALTLTLTLTLALAPALALALTRHARARRRCMACAGAGYGGAVLAILAASVATYDPLGARWAEEHTPFYGVNLGGWLLTER